MKKPKSLSRETQKLYRSRVKKLQTAGLLGKIDLRKAHDPKARRAILKYADYLSGTASAIKVKTEAQARELRKKYKALGTGSTVVIPKEKTEKVRINAKGEIISTRKNPIPGRGDIKKVKGSREVRAPKEGEQIYYTIPEHRRGLGKVVRHTFSNFDDMLEYLSKYDINFDDIEDFIETEYVKPASRKKTRLDKKISRERRKAYEKWKTKKRRTKPRARKVRRRTKK